MTVIADTGTQRREVVVIGGGQGGLAAGYFLAQQNRRFTILEAAGDIGPAVAWGASMPLLVALGWSATSVTGISVEDQFTVFGAAGAVVFTLLSGVVLAYFAAPALQHASQSSRTSPPKEMP